MTLGAAALFAALANSRLRLGALLGVTISAAAMVSLLSWCLGNLAFSRLLRINLQWRLSNASLGPRNSPKRKVPATIGVHGGRICANLHGRLSPVSRLLPPYLRESQHGSNGRCVVFPARDGRWIYEPAKDKLRYPTGGVPS